MSVTTSQPTESFVWYKSKSGKIMLAGFAVILLLSVTQAFAKVATTDITSSGTWSVAVGWSIPILLAGLGGIFAERSGVVNIGLEGMMVFGTFAGAVGTILVDPWFGMALAAVAGALGGLIMAVATVSFQVDHIIAGVAINVMGIATRYGADLFFPSHGGSITQSPPLTAVKTFDIPLISSLLQGIEDKAWFFISDLAGILAGFVTHTNVYTLLFIAFVPIAIWILWRTRFGLRLRSAGEQPIAADSVGVNVYKYKYYGVVISGALAGLGGGFLSIVLTGIYKEGQTVGKGFIGLATMLFGNYNPVGTAGGSLLFGFAETLRLRDEAAPHGLILSVAIVLGLAMAYFLYKKSWKKAGALGLIFFLVALTYWFTDSVTPEIPKITPHIAVLVVLLFFSGRLRMPKFDGVPYRKGDH
jgi:ABC-type uncharacterized transport system permease subunit